jgi:hypothetical protein
MPDKATLSSFALTATIVLAAIVLRSTFLLVQTRTHIIGFIIVAACCELVIRPRLHQRPSLAWFGINVAFAVAAILMTRWHIEGLCPGLHQAKCVPRL